MLVGAAGCVAPAPQISPIHSQVRSIPDPEPQVMQVEQVEEVEPQDMLSSDTNEEPEKSVGTSYQCTPVPTPIEKDTQQILDEALASCQVAQEYWQKGELEQAIDALDQAYAMLLSIDSENGGPGVFQAKEDLRFLISKRMLEIYTSRFYGGHRQP